MGDQLLPLPLTEQSVHLCVDMQRIFSDKGPWPTPWIDRVLAVTAELFCVSRVPFSRASFHLSVRNRCRGCGTLLHPLAAATRELS